MNIFLSQFASKSIMLLTKYFILTNFNYRSFYFNQKTEEKFMLRQRVIISLADMGLQIDGGNTISLFSSAFGKIPYHDLSDNYNSPQVECPFCHRGHLKFETLSLILERVNPNPNEGRIKYRFVCSNEECPGTFIWTS